MGRQKNGLKFSLTDLKKVVSKYLLLDHEEIIDVISATYVANRMTADPLWMLLIAPPSSAKTETLRAFDGHPGAFLISNLTPATLVSGIIPKKGRPDPSLLPLLSDKLVILKDFTTVLSMRSENQAEILAQLREIYDGSYTKIFGNGKELTWNGRIGVLGACTPAYDKHYAVIGAMGERFLLYRTGTKDAPLTGIRAQKMVGHEEEMRADIRKAFHRFICQFDEPGDLRFETDEILNRQIVSLACFCAYGRCPVERDYRSQCILYEPQPEGPARLTKQLSQLAMALAMVHGKPGIDEEVYSIVKKVGRDILPVQRRRIVEFMWRKGHWGGTVSWTSTTDVADAAGMPAATARMLLEDLMSAGAIDRRRGESDGGRPPWEWQLANGLVELIAQGEVFE